MGKFVLFITQSIAIAHDEKEIQQYSDEICHYFISMNLKFKNHIVLRRVNIIEDKCQ